MKNLFWLLIVCLVIVSSQAEAAITLFMDMVGKQKATSWGSIKSQ